MIDIAKLPDVPVHEDDKVESLEDVARILATRKRKLAFGDLAALKPYIACAACIISLSNTIPPHRF
jgi:hypothetical protein